MGELGATVMVYPPGWVTLPVAIFDARRNSAGLASSLALAIWSSSPFVAARLGATSVSQMIVSAASSWQKNRRV